jgi:hypothetical protein
LDSALFSCAETINGNRVRLENILDAHQFN